MMKNEMEIGGIKAENGGEGDIYVCIFDMNEPKW
jgi:hypothetical protein